jgi:hypothetical protein
MLEIVPGEPRSSSNYISIQARPPKTVLIRARRASLPVRGEDLRMANSAIEVDKPDIHQGPGLPSAAETAAIPLPLSAHVAASSHYPLNPFWAALPAFFGCAFAGTFVTALNEFWIKYHIEPGPWYSMRLEVIWLVSSLLLMAFAAVIFLEPLIEQIRTVPTRGQPHQAQEIDDHVFRRRLAKAGVGVALLIVSMSHGLVHQYVEEKMSNHGAAALVEMGVAAFIVYGTTLFWIFGARTGRASMYGFAAAVILAGIIYFVCDHYNLFDAKHSAVFHAPPQTAKSDIADTTPSAVEGNPLSLAEFKNRIMWAVLAWAPFGLIGGLVIDRRRSGRLSLVLPLALIITTVAGDIAMQSALMFYYKQPFSIFQTLLWFALGLGWGSGIFILGSSADLLFHRQPDLHHSAPS